ncbi:MAG: hypothetical protein ABI609_13135 [Acidobacteriota bacterium]
MIRFILFALLLLLLVQAGYALAGDLLGFAPDVHALSGRTRVSAGLPAAVQLAAWMLESTALLALFLLVQGKSGAWWLDGLATAWIAWVFRGPLLVFAAVTLGGLQREPWWGLAFHWLGLYSLSGLLLAGLGRWMRIERS